MLLQGLPGIISEQNLCFRALTPADSLKCSYGAAVLPEKSCHMDNFRLSAEKKKTKQAKRQYKEWVKSQTSYLVGIPG